MNFDRDKILLEPLAALFAGLFGGRKKNVPNQQPLPEEKSESEIEQELNKDFNAKVRRNQALNILTRRGGSKLGQ